MHDLKTFSSDITKIIGVNITTVKWKRRTAEDVKVIVVEDGHRPIIGRDISQLGLSLIVNQNQCPIKLQIALDFPVLISSIGKPGKRADISSFYKKTHPNLAERTWVPINIQLLGNTKLKKFIDENHILKFFKLFR